MKKYNSFVKILLLIALAAMVLVCAGCGKTEEQAAKEEAIRKAKELNESWAEEEPKAEEKPEEPSGDDGTRI